MSFTGEGVGKIRRELDNATSYTDDSGREKRAPDKVAFVGGLALLGFVLINVWIYYYGMLTLGWQWGDVSGFYTFVATFTASTFVPFIVRGWKSGRGENRRQN